MTYTCETCNGPVELIDDNGAEYPETRVERFECVDCGHEQTLVLTP